MNDTLQYSADVEEHVRRLKEVLIKVKVAGVHLNDDNDLIRNSKVLVYGHITSSD